MFLTGFIVGLVAAALAAIWFRINSESNVHYWNGQLPFTSDLPEIKIPDEEDQ